MVWLFFILGFYFGGIIAMIGLIVGAVRSGLLPMPEELPPTAVVTVIVLWPYTLPKGLIRGF